MGITRFSFLLVLGTGVLAVGAESAEAPQPKSEASATVTVTAEADPVEVRKTPNPVTVVDKTTLERLGARQASELLQALFPGQVMSNGGVGTVSSFFLGGARNQDVAVTLDGIRLKDPMGLGGLDMSQVSLLGVDRAEIQQGACTVGQGAMALGGVLALYSAGQAPQGFSGTASLGVGSQDIRRASLSSAYGWGTGWIRMGAGASQEDQAIPVLEPYRTVATSLGVGQQLGESTLLTANYRNSYSGTPLPFDASGYGVTPRFSSEFKEQREAEARLQVYSASLRSELTDRWAIEATVGGWDQVRLDPDYTTGLPTQRYASNGSQFTPRLVWKPSAGSVLSAALDVSRERGVSPDYTDPSLANVGEGQHAALVLEASTELPGNLRLLAACRREEDRLDVQPAGSSLSARKDTAATTGKLGLNWIATPEWRFYVSGGTSYSHPLLYQLLYNLSNGGSDLDTERSYTLQAGGDWTRDRWKVRMVLSRTFFDRMIYYDPSSGVASPWGGMTGAYQNGKNIRIQSAELGVGYGTASWGLEGFYRNQEARDLDQPESSQLSASSVIRRPFQSLGLSGFWVWGDLRLDGRWAWFGSRYEYGLPSAYKAHFNDLSLSATYAFRKDLTLAVKGQHLLQPRLSREEWLSRSHDYDNDASMVYGFPAQPPTVALDVTYRF